MSGGLIKEVAKALGVVSFEPHAPEAQIVGEIDYSYVNYKGHVWLTQDYIYADNLIDLVTADYFEQCDFVTACGKRWDNWRWRNLV